jgi:HEPN domain-containing protein
MAVKPTDWLKRANSNLAFAKLVFKDEYGLLGGEIFFEDPCFELQQCAEKSLKALLLQKEVSFPKIHNISRLLELLQENFIDIPDKMIDANILTQYAVRTRYPDDFRRITREEFEEALEIAESVYNWVNSQINHNDLGCNLNEPE